MERWQFIESPNGAWYWLASDVLTHRTRTSAATFTTRYECIADAASSGYQTNAAGGSRTPTNSAPRHRRRSGQRRERYA